MKKLDAIRCAGSKAKLARALGVTPSAVSQWGDELPKQRAWQVRAMYPEWVKRGAKNARPR